MTYGRACGALKISIRPDYVSAVEELLRDRKHLFDSCWFHMTDFAGVSVELTFPAITHELLKTIEDLYEAAWPGVLSNAEGGAE